MQVDLAVEEDVLIEAMSGKWRILGGGKSDSDRNDHEISLAVVPFSTTVMSAESKVVRVRTAQTVRT